MRTLPNNKIIIHCTLVILVIGILIYYIEINRSFLIFLSGFLILTLLLNRTTYLNFKKNQLKVIKKNFLFIPTFKLSIDINAINKLTLIDNQIKDNKDTRLLVDFEAGIIAEIITGTYFYKPTYTLIISLGQNNLKEIEINTKKKDVEKIKDALKNIVPTISEDW